MADLSLLQDDPLTVARLRDALGRLHRIQAYDSWTALEAQLADSGSDGCIVDANFPTRREALDRLELLQIRHPGVAVVAFGDFQDEGRDVYRLGRLGVDGLVAAHAEDDAGRVRAAVEDSLVAARARQATRLLDGRMDPRAIRGVGWATEYAPAGHRVTEFAEAMATHPRGLARRFAEWGLPGPGRLLVWGRLLQAGALLARDERTVEEAAFRVGYASASGLARAMKREVGLTPGAVAAGGGLEAVHRRLFPSRGGTRGGGVLRLLLVALLLLLPAGGCATGSGSGAPSAGSRLRQPPLDRVHLGIHVVEAASGRVVLSRNADRKFIPASNQKILTTSAALALLGPGYRYETSFWAEGELRGDTLSGDLVLAGSGDPTLSARFGESGEAALAGLADSLLADGVGRVRGRLVVDVSAWDSTSVPGAWEYGDLPWSYGATGGAFAVDEGVIHAELRGGRRPGDPALLTEWWPRGDPSFLRADLITVHPDSSRRVRPVYLPESGAVILRGRVPAASVDTLRLAMREPVRQSAALLFRVLEERGIRVEGGLTLRWPPEDGAGTAAACTPTPACTGARRLAGIHSPSLSRIVKGILEPSQNWMAEQLLRTLGAERGSGGSREAGARVVRSWAVGLGVDSLDVDPSDGSGLSVRNLVTPRTLVRVLRHVRASDHGPAYRDALASPGEVESTLEHRLLDLEGRLFAKTGTISNVDALSGYLVREDGTELVFSILSNASGMPSSTIRNAVDDVVRALAQG